MGSSSAAPTRIDGRGARRHMRRVGRSGALVVALVWGLAQRAPAVAQVLRLSSPAFAHGTAIPKKYTCDRAGISPPLRWTGAPAATRSFVVFAEDIDVPAGTWPHWVLYDLPARSTGVRQGLPSSERLPSGAKQGTNEFGKIGYSGPCPPPGPMHSYYFRVYALDAPTGLEPGATKVQVIRAMRHHVLAVAEVAGTYERRRGHGEASAPPGTVP